MSDDKVRDVLRIDDVDTLKLITDPTRWEIVERLVEPLSVTELAERMDVPPRPARITVSGFLKRRVIPAGRVVLVVAEVLAQLLFQRRLQRRLGQCYGCQQLVDRQRGHGMRWVS